MNISFFLFPEPRSRAVPLRRRVSEVGDGERGTALLSQSSVHTVHLLAHIQRLRLVRPLHRQERVRELRPRDPRQVPAQGTAVLTCVCDTRSVF